MRNLFIDTNVLLSFYHFSSDDLEELRKLTLLVGQGELKLYFPDQVRDEFFRNRPSKISDALKRLRSQTVSVQFPQLSKDYGQYEQLRELQRQYSRLHTDLVNQIEEDVRLGGLKADSVLNELFAQAAQVPTTAQLVERARLRMDLANPPGKKGSLGDAVIWEALLETVPQGQGLCLITDDSDFNSALNEDELHPFLAAEWSARKHSPLTLFKRLSRFFQTHYPQIELATEEEKDSLIRELAASRSFRRTHELIDRLAAFAEFTDAQLSEIARAAATNNQIYYIINDPDVRDFLVATLRQRAPFLENDTIERLNQLFGEEVFDLIPF